MAIKQNLPIDHPAVKKYKKFSDDIRDKKNKDRSPLLKKILGGDKRLTLKEVKKIVDKAETVRTKQKTATEGSFKDGGRVKDKTKPKKPLSGSMKKPKPGSQSYQFLQTQKPRPTTSKRGGGLATRGMGAAMQNGGRVMGKGQGRVMRKRPTFNISMKRS